MSDADLKILDCTLRDGGYYNDWDFSDFSSGGSFSGGGGGGGGSW